MATHNKSRCLGFLETAPQITKNSKGEINGAILLVTVTHRNPTGYRRPGESGIDRIFIVCDENPQILRTAVTLSVGDFVDIEGLYTTRQVEKGASSVCENCGASHNIKYGVQCCIHPLYMQKIKPFEYGDPESLEMLRTKKITHVEILKKNFLEVSNDTILLGYAMREPEELENNSVRYPVTVGRKKFIPSQSHIDTDYPYIYSYGEQAQNDLKYIKPGTLLLINGFIRNRKVHNYITCEACGNQYTFKDYATEIIPYSVEYLNNTKE